MTSKPLRLKDLINVNLNVDREIGNHASADYSGRGRFLCAVSQKAITSQPVILLKKFVILVI